jgi:hypothetical protein
MMVQKTMKYGRHSENGARWEIIWSSFVINTINGTKLGWSASCGVAEPDRGNLALLDLSQRGDASASILLDCRLTLQTK